VFDEIPQPEKVLKDTQNRDVPGIMAWDHYMVVGIFIATVGPYGLIVRF
jgi:hypothetical protein